MTSLNTQLDINALVEMGFTKERVELAVKSVKNPDIQSVVEWLFSHPVAEASSGHRLGDTAASPAQPNINEGSNGNGQEDSKQDVEMSAESNGSGGESTTTTTDAPASAEGAGAALSLVCEDCGKQIRSEMDAQTHAARTGHQHFAESSEAVKPLTDEEKAAQKIRLQQKLEERRKEREVAEKEEAKVRERTRRKTGKELSQAKEEQALKEMKRIAEERRQEKREELRLKQKLKDEIAKDRAQFKKTVPAAPKTEVAAVVTPQAPAPKKEYNTCRIQFRLVDGSTQNSNFKADDLLQNIFDHLNNQVMHNTPFDLSMTFPRKIFSDADKSKTLKELGLVPSAVLVIKKCI